MPSSAGAHVAWSSQSKGCSPEREPVRTGRLICGEVRFDHPAARNLLELLPRVIHVEASSSTKMDLMQSTLRLMAAEVMELRPGGETVIHR